MFRMMKLRPPHGWNAVAWELAIVTLGVLIALVAQQVVEGINQRGEARDAEQAIRGELEANFARLQSRSTIKPCVDRRLGEIQGLIDSAAAGGGAFKTPSWIGRPQFWTMQVARWQATSEAGGTALIPANQLARYGSMYSLMNRANDEMAKEQEDWAELRSLEHLRRLSPDMAFRLMATLQQARYSNFRMEVWTRQLRDVFDQLKLHHVVNEVAPSRSACVPMDTPRAQAIKQSNSFVGDEP